MTAIPQRAFVVVLLLLASALSTASAENTCTPVGELVPICGLHGSEDLEALPGGGALLVSQSRVDVTHSPAMLWLPGSIALLDLASRKARGVYPVAPDGVGRGAWGDPTCPGEIGATMAPHGLHLSKRSDGRLQLLVVNHGGRESVEFFEVTGRGRETRLEWRGCAVAPAYSFLNDVAALPDGGLLVTTMTRNDSPEAMFRDRPKADRGENTGHVWRWRPRAGFEVQPGSAAPMPNGLQVDHAGRTLYLNVGTTHGGGVRKINIATGKELGFASLSDPDNSSWGADGRLLVAGLSPGADIAPCLKAGFDVPCGAKARVTAVDPTAMTVATLVEHEGPPMGLFTGVVQVGEYLYVGSTSVDRVLRVPMPGRR